MGPGFLSTGSAAFLNHSEESENFTSAGGFKGTLKVLAFEPGKEQIWNTQVDIFG